MTIAKLYNKHVAGEISKSAFLYEARKDQNLPFITNLTSYEDAIKILKNKSIISEKQELTIIQVIDRLNPYHFKSAVEFEVSKIKGDLSKEEYEKIREKVAKKMQKDPLAYEYTKLANAKEIEKRDAKLSMQPVKNQNFKDKDNEMKKAKGQSEAKKNTKASTKENKKGKPKGVKEMKGSTKKPKGVSKVMDPQGKEKILESRVSAENLYNFLVENNVIPTDRTDYAVGHEVQTPKGFGKVVEKHGSIIEVEMEDGAKETFTLNVLDKHNAKNRFDDEPKPQDINKSQRDQMWSDWDKQHHKPFDTMGQPSSTQDLLKKLKGLLEKLKSKKELKKEAGDLVTVTTPAGEEKVINTTAAGKGTEMANKLKSKGFTSAKSITGK